MTNQNNNLENTKAVVRCIVGFSVARTVKTIIKNNLDEDESTLNNVAFTIGAVAIGSMFVHVTHRYTDAKINEFANSYHKAKIRNAQKKTSTNQDL